MPAYHRPSLHSMRLQGRSTWWRQSRDVYRFHPILEILHSPHPLRVSVISDTFSTQRLLSGPGTAFITATPIFINRSQASALTHSDLLSPGLQNTICGPKCSSCSCLLFAGLRTILRIPPTTLIKKRMRGRMMDEYKGSLTVTMQLDQPLKPR